MRRRGQSGMICLRGQLGKVLIRVRPRNVIAIDRIAG
jgi:hypothetical protein